MLSNTCINSGLKFILTYSVFNMPGILNTLLSFFPPKQEMSSYISLLNIKIPGYEIFSVYRKLQHLILTTEFYCCQITKTKIKKKSLRWYSNY